MNHLALWFVAVLVFTTAGTSSCGSANLAPPPYLQVKTLFPSDGAASVSPQVEPILYFTGELDASSVTASSFYMEWASLEDANLECDPDNRDPCECKPWQETIEGQRVVEGSKLVFKPSAALVPNRCYRLTCTTAIRGVELGPLEDMHWPASCRQKVGAQGVFCTAEQ